MADRSKSGRRGRELTLNPRAGAVVGVDFGFRHVRVLLCDLAHNVLAAAEQELTESHTSAAALPTTARMLDEMLDEAKFSRAEILNAGVALPGPVRHDASDSVVQSAVLPGWSGATNESVGAALGVRARIDNDANLAALGEHTWGAAQGISDCVVIKFHSGIGCGLIVGGQVVRGAFGGAGEIGHTTVDERGPLCRCGKRGCLDSFASVPAIIEALRPQHGDITLAGVMALLSAGDPGVVRVVTDAAQLVGKAIADACNLLAPERVVLVGAMTQAGNWIVDPISAALKRHVAPGQPPEVVLGLLGRRHTALGAVALALEESRRFLGTTRPVTGQGHAGKDERPLGPLYETSGYLHALNSKDPGSD
jgi:predicted NBD/HSP70 family sugar kinase